jgi:hypothetical protein
MCGLDLSVSCLSLVTSGVHYTEPSGFRKRQGYLFSSWGTVSFTRRQLRGVKLLGSELFIVEVAGVIWREILFVAKKASSLFSV